MGSWGLGGIEFSSEVGFWGVFWSSDIDIRLDKKLFNKIFDYLFYIDISDTEVYIPWG